MKTCKNCAHLEVCEAHCERQHVEGCSTCMLSICGGVCGHFQKIAGVVYCMDCTLCDCGRCTRTGLEMEYDDFCSHGVREEDD